MAYKILRARDMPRSQYRKILTEVDRGEIILKILN